MKERDFLVSSSMVEQRRHETSRRGTFVTGPTYRRMPQVGLAKIEGDLHLQVAAKAPDTYWTRVEFVPEMVSPSMNSSICYQIDPTDETRTQLQRTPVDMWLVKSSVIRVA